MLVNVIVAAIVALIIYFVATTLIGHPLIVGLVCLLVFLLVAFGSRGYYPRRGGPPV